VGISAARFESECAPFGIEMILGSTEEPRIFADQLSDKYRISPSGERQLAVAVAVPPMIDP
jgi:hypothetical protein